MADLRLELLSGRQHGPGDDPYLNSVYSRHRLAPAFDAAVAVADYAAWRARNPR